MGAGYPTVTNVPRATRMFHAAKIKARYANVADAIKGQARAYFAKGLAPVVTAADVRKIVLSRDPRYQIVSVQQTADYAAGHIKGATNIVWTDIADKTAKLDPHKMIIIYCYGGQTGAQASMFLNLMGYKAYNVLSGMSSWNNDPAVGGFSFYNPAAVANCPAVKQRGTAGTARPRRAPAGALLAVRDRRRLASRGIPACSARRSSGCRTHGLRL